MDRAGDSKYLPNPEFGKAGDRQRSGQKMLPAAKADTR